jgi:hypothetical protein
VNTVTPPKCPTCKRDAVFYASSERIYGRDYGPVWACPSRICDTYVGVHEGTQIPKGTLATKPMREGRKAAHYRFDPLWKDLRLAYPEIPVPGQHLRSIARKRAYTWLAAQLGIPFDDCHIAMFDVAQCARVVQVIEANKPTSASVRAWFKSQQQAGAAA